MKYLDKLIQILNWTAIVPLLISYLAGYINPQQNSIFAFFGLVFPFFLFLNIAFVLYWLFRKRKLFLISLFSIILGYGSVFHSFAFNLKKTIQDPPENSIKIMSYNVRLFNKWQWLKSKNITADIFKLLELQDPELLCLQEFYSNPADINAEKRLKEGNYSYNYIRYNKYRKRNAHHGLAIFSKYPIINSGDIDLFSSKEAIFADIVLPQHDTVRVINIHLASVHLEKKDYEFIDDVKTPRNTEKMKSLKEILVKLRSAFVRRSGEVHSLIEQVKLSPYKVILCGDFNSTPQSYEYQNMITYFNDAFTQAGWGMGVSYNHALSLFRIDHIFLNKEIVAEKIQIPDIELSDHFPVILYFSIKE